MKVISIFFISIFLMISCGGESAEESNSYEIVINEIVRNHKSDGSDWIELYNNSEDLVDISGWRISSSDIQNSYEIPQNTKIFPGAYLVFSNISSSKYLFDFVLGEVDRVVLNDLDGEAVDKVNWSESSFPDSKSYSRIPNGYGVFDDLDNYSIGGENNPDSYYAGDDSDFNPDEEDDEEDDDEAVDESNVEIEHSEDDSDIEENDNSENLSYEGKMDDELLMELYNVTNHGGFSYNKARDYIYGGVEVFDGKIESVYNATEIPGPIDKTVAYNMNISTEHSWPQSHFDSQSPAAGDIHHLFPAVVNINSTRSNNDFGEVETVTHTFCGGSECSYLGKSKEGRTVFEVREKRRGDIARAHFYMVARYKFSNVPIDDSNKVMVGCSDGDGCINQSEEAALRKWHEEDPVDERETIRNDRIEEIQGNRNPFIDEPKLVERISDF